MLESVKKILSRNPFPRVLFIYGEEQYLVEKSFEEITSELQKKDSNLIHEHLNLNSSADRKEKFDYGTFNSLINTTSMFSENRLITITGIEVLFSSKTKDSPLVLFEEYLKKPNLDTMLIIKFINTMEWSKPKPLKSPYNVISKLSESLYYKKLNEAEIRTFIDNFFKNSGKTISDDASYFLQSQANNDLTMLASEIEKIDLHFKNKTTISLSDISEFLGVEKDYNIFELTKAIANKDLAKSLIIIEKLGSTPDSLRPVISQLYTFFSKVMKVGELMASNVSDNQIATELGTYPKYINEFKLTYRNLGDAKINRTFELISYTDERIKSSQGSLVYNLQSLITNIMQ